MRVCLDGTMTITDMIDASRDLVASRIVKVCTDARVPWAIAHVLDLDTMKSVNPPKSVFLNALVLATKFQYFQIGPFKTPYDLDVGAHGLPVVGDIVLGETGTNSKGTFYTSWLPDRWARPVCYFFHCLVDTYEAACLYENRDPALRMLLLARLTVMYGQVPDERLYDMLCLILFDDHDALLTMCYKAQHRPKNGRMWDLTDSAQTRALTKFCADLGGSSVHVPSVPEFVEEVAYIMTDSGICAHFRSALEIMYQESKDMFQSNVQKWLADKDGCLSSKLIQALLDNKQES